MTLEDYRNILALINRVRDIAGAEAMAVAVLQQKIQAEMKAIERRSEPVANALASLALALADVTHPLAASNAIAAVQPVKFQFVISLSRPASTLLSICEASPSAVEWSFGLRSNRDSPHAPTKIAPTSHR